MPTVGHNFHSMLSNSLLYKNPTSPKFPLPPISPYFPFHQVFSFSLADRFRKEQPREWLSLSLRKTQENVTMANLAVALQKEGSSAFRFDFAGNGESEGSFQYGNYFREADDLHAVIQHFHEENRVVSAILGHSKGGNVVLLYAYKYCDIPAVINVSGRYDLKRGIEERLGINFMQRIEKDRYIDVKNKTGVVVYRVTQKV
ncbi:uncharacterized protein LOC110808321 isoform X2 [Carica papaya]|uniref:uncharacterized protein LOC110808321 isoform X2 n=1 Tax=Carica papaya TaxID=3649 RepID=UPI000B8CF78E|nr:uncharacterized protein LOC110808321 isoform X2 [Carica papaya]